MAFDEQDRFDHTETDNHVNEQNQTAGTAQNEGTEGSGLYRMTREDLKNSTLYTDTDRRSEYTSGTAYENRTNTAHTGSSYAAGNDTAIIIRHRIAAAMAETAAATISIQVLRNIIPGRRAVLARRWLRQHVSALSSDWQLQL